MKSVLKAPARPLSLLFTLFLIVSLFLLALSFTQSVFTSTASYSPNTCAVPGNTLYLLDGASVGVSGDLSFTAGPMADKDTMPQASNGAHLVYEITGVTGTYTNVLTQFSLFVDAGTAVGNGIRAEIRYDFDGNGSADRIETYHYFATNPIVDWENYTHTNTGGIQTATGSYSNLSNGAIQIRLWNAIGGAPSSTSF